MANRWENDGNSSWLFFWAPKSLKMVTAAMKLKTLAPWKESYDQPRQHIKKHRHYFVNKGPSSQGYGFSSSHVWMWELNYKKKSWAQKNWCFWTVVLEKTSESPLDCKEIQPVHPNGGQSWVFIGGTDIESETPIRGRPMWRADSFEKTLMLGKIEGRRRREWQRMKWLDGHRQHNGHGFGWAQGIGNGQGGLVCCSSWGRKKLDMTEWLNWTELNWAKMDPECFHQG